MKSTWHQDLEPREGLGGVTYLCPKLSEPVALPVLQWLFFSICFFMLNLSCST